MVRTGIVSSVDMENGTVDVFYDDMDGEVSHGITCLEVTGMPKVGDMVAVIHRDDTEEGICLGRVFNENNPPK